MVAASFDESNVALSKPADMTHEECEPLSVWIGPTPEGKPVVISCWKFTKEELEIVNKTGRLWLWVHGEVMVPVSLEVQHPFQK